MGLECNLKDETCGYRCTGYDGSKIWAEVHRIHKKIDCKECSDHARRNFSGLHDGVNIGLGKKPHDPANFSKFAQEIACAYAKCKKDGDCK